MELPDVVRELPEDIQRLFLDKVGASYAAWILDKVLVVDCLTYQETGGMDDLKFIQLCATLGWIERAILITVSESSTHFFGKRLKTLKLARFEEVRDIIRALSGLPYIFDEECRHLLDPTVGKKPSALYVEYPASPFPKGFPCNWKPCPGYNPLDHQGIGVSGWEDEEED